MINARATTPTMHGKREGSSFITWSPACAKQGGCCVTKAEQKPAMLIACGVCLFPLQCTSQTFQAANPRIEVSPKQHMPFCLCCCKVHSQLCESAINVILL